MSKIRHWMSSHSSSAQNSFADQSGSQNSRHSRTRSKTMSTNNLAISASMNKSSGSGESKLIIHQTESFELTEKIIHDDGQRSGSGSGSEGLGNPGDFHFGPRHDERAGFHAI